MERAFSLVRSPQFSAASWWAYRRWTCDLLHYLYNMNYLAHFALSGTEEEIIVGNYIGDSLRGVNTKNFSERVQMGIKLHRFIDDYTDHHPVFILAKKCFSGEFENSEPPS